MTPLFAGIIAALCSFFCGKKEDFSLHKSSELPSPETTRVELSRVKRTGGHTEDMSSSVSLHAWTPLPFASFP